MTVCRDRRRTLPWAAVLVAAALFAGHHAVRGGDSPAGKVIAEIRPVGSMTSSPPNRDPHREGGGDQDVIIAFSIRGDGVLYELLDDEQNIIGTISMQDLVDLFKASRAAQAA